MDAAVRISLTSLTRGEIRLRADDRTIKVFGELLDPPKGSDSPNFWTARNSIVWDDGSPTTESEKDEVTRALHDYAREHGLIFEID